jgi:predicted helicase
LAFWHLNYETIEPYPLAQHSPNLTFDPAQDCKVEKMRFRKIGKEEDKTTIIYNSKITLSGVPRKAYDYVVNGKSAIEWIMERYAVTTHKDSGLINDPNLWTLEHDDPEYILNLVKRVVRVSLETVTIVEGLPPLNEATSKKGL